MLPGGREGTGNRGDRWPRTSVDDSEVEISGVAVLPEVNEPQRSPALEYQAPSVLRSRAMGLGDDVSQDVVALDDGCVDSVGVGSAGDGVAGEHG
jgi:hypothetical protein